MPVPPSTYRLQIRPSFGLRAAAQLCEYLRELGAGAVYLSPILASASGSEHGYDVVDFSRVDDARGGAAGWRALVDAAHGLQLVLDVVPNHTGIADAAENEPWWDVLRLGSGSPYARWFDIDWTRGRVLLPVLGDDFDAARDLSVAADELRHGSHRFPIAPGTTGGSAAQVHDRQHYELVSFRSAEQSYRRFFAVPTLAGLRVEDPAVFDATHREVLRLVRDGVAGLRIDHPDGLADPLGYLSRLRAAVPDAWLTVEKILEPGEALPRSWPVAGTTGYDALAEVSALFVDPSAEAALSDLYRSLTGDQLSFDQHVEAGKRLVATTILRPEVRRLAGLCASVPDAAEAITELLVAFPVYRSYLPEEASHLTKFGSKVIVVHRRDKLRASHIMQKRLLENPKVEVIWDSVAEEAVGDRALTGVKVRNLKTDQVHTVHAGGLFYAIGHEPNTSFLERQVELDETGYIVTKPGTTQTSVTGVFAAGDVQDKIWRQAVTAAGTGCMAALEAERFLVEQGET